MKIRVGIRVSKGARDGHWGFGLRAELEVSKLGASSHDSLEVTVPISLLQFHVDNPPQQPAWEWLSIELSTAASAGGQRQGWRTIGPHFREVWTHKLL